MKQFFALTFLALGAMIQAQVADVGADFGVAATNPNGDWTYGYFPTTLGLGFTPYSVYANNINGIGWSAPQSAGQLGTPAAWVNLGPPTNGVNTGQFAMHPGPVEIAVARFIVPGSWGSGIADITGLFGSGDIGSVSGTVMVNGVSLFGSTVGGSSVPFSLLGVNLTSGDTVDFAIDNFDGFLFDSTPLDARIEFAPVPEPASFAVLGLGAFALLKRRRK